MKMFEEYIKNHDDKEIIKFLSESLNRTCSCLEKAMNEQNTFNLSMNVALILEINEMLKFLDKKMNGAKSKVVL